MESLLTHFKALTSEQQEEFMKLINPDNIICDRNLFKTCECDVIFIITQKGVNKRSELEDKFNQEIEELSIETEYLVSEIDKWQM